MTVTLQKIRSQYEPKLPPVLHRHGANIRVVDESTPRPLSDREQIERLFPHTYGLPILRFDTAESTSSPPKNVGVIFSGGQAPGGHNVIAGLYDGLVSLNSENKLYGFIAGPDGLLENRYTELDAEKIGPYRNTGGFDLIGSGRTKLHDPDQFDRVRKNCEQLKISALVIIGGDDSNTNACLLAEYYLKTKADIQVIGCPKTIDGDLKNEWIETSFGFDTACKVYCELIGNLGRDALSARKYWHFVKIMGRSASHIALECSLQTHPNITIISEEVADKKLTLGQLVETISEIIRKRADRGYNYGVAVIPEGLIEFIPEMKRLISELNELLAKSPGLAGKIAAAKNESELEDFGLSPTSAHAYFALPHLIRSQLVLVRDPHGNVQVSKIETEKLLIQKVEEHLEKHRKSGHSKNVKFSAQSHFFGYEGRCAPPSNFDADYCYGLGYTAAALIGAGKSGYIAAIRNLREPVSEWKPGGIPVTAMMNIERRSGSDEPVIRKALVDLKGKPFLMLTKNADSWALNNDYISTGPIQFFGPPELTDQPTMTLLLETGD